ncbi:MAG: hypothetical protein ACRDZ4_21865 [Egibacteraceae bacterium]
MLDVDLGAGGGGAADRCVTQERLWRPTSWLMHAVVGAVPVLAGAA